MPNVKLADVNRSAALLKKIVARADLNKDGAIRDGDMRQIREHLGVAPKTSGRWLTPEDGPQLVAGINSAVGRAKSRGGPQLEKIYAAIDDFKALAKAADVDKNGQLDPVEQKRLRTGGEKQFMNFVNWSKSKTMSDIDLPEQHAFAKPKFKWSGTPQEVCQSLLAAHSDPKNDNFWPDWGGKGAARYVLSAAEANEMTTALAPLFPARQKAVLTELAKRTGAVEFGCVSPDNAAKKVLEKYADSLGLKLVFKQPAAPKITF
jgi:hypothetical protein